MSTRRVVCRVSDEPWIIEEFDRWRAECDRLRERAGFITKQMEKLVEEKDKAHDLFWRSLEGRLQEKGLLSKEFTHDDYNLQYDEVVGAMIEQKNSELKEQRGGISLSLGEILKGIVPPDPSK